MKKRLLLVYECDCDGFSTASVWVGDFGEGLDQFQEDLPQHTDDVIYAAYFEGDLEEAPQLIAESILR